MSETSMNPQHWYRTHGAQPFTLTKFISSPDSKSFPFFCVAPFPWHLDSLASDGLYNASEYRRTELQQKWQDAIRPWIGSVMVGSTGCAYIFRKSVPPLCIRVPPTSQEVNTDERNVKCVAWSLDPRSWTNPLVIITAFRMIFIYDPATTRVVGSLRGHGGDITSIAVHHIHPYMFLTTSRDQTTRLYDLRFAPNQRPNNPPWPPAKRQSDAGPAFGLHMTESEGDGWGRCLAVLVGGRSGGHQAAVLHATWHPTTDLIATCGADRSVKIWRIPEINYEAVHANKEHLTREDKPLFSTDLIHKARVLSVWWLSDDILVSHSASALMRGRTADRMYEEPGTVSVWRWLGFDRFLPAGKLRKNMTGCISDWRNSESFRLLSVYSVPFGTPSIHVSMPPSRSRDPLMFVPDGSRIRIFNIAQFLPRDPPSFPLDRNEADDDELTQEFGMDYDPERLAPETYRPEKPEKKLFDDVEGWVAEGNRAGQTQGQNSLPDIEHCVLAFDGQVLLGTGKRGTLYSWKLTAQ